MRFFRVFLLLILLGGDYGPKPASLEALPTQAVGCDGRSNLLFSPEEDVLLQSPSFQGLTSMLIIVAFLGYQLIIYGADLGEPIPDILFHIWQR